MPAKKSEEVLLSEIGKTYNNLTCLKYLGHITNGKKKKEHWFKWQCVCGKIKENTWYNVSSGSIKSCGEHPKYPIGHKTKFNQTVINYKQINRNGKKDGWSYLVECYCEDKTHRWVSPSMFDRDKGCGCKNKNKNRNEILLNKRIGNIRNKAKRRNRKFLLLKDYVYELIFVKNCHYCNKEPSESSNMTTERKMSNIRLHTNTVDRIDSDLDYSVDNVLTACYECNISKSNLNYLDFKNKIVKIFLNDEIPTRLINYSQKEKGILISRVKYNANRRKIFFDLSDDTIIELMTSRCFYCNEKLTNKENYRKWENKKYIKTQNYFLYNGIDRKDSSKGYIEDNVVSCCKWCNSMKNNRSIKDFKEWVEHVYNHWAK